jgi:hypothetical protein
MGIFYRGLNGAIDFRFWILDFGVWIGLSIVLGIDGEIVLGIDGEIDREINYRLGSHQRSLFCRYDPHQLSHSPCPNRRKRVILSANLVVRAMVYSVQIQSILKGPFRGGPQQRNATVNSLRFASTSPIPPDDWRQGEDRVLDSALAAATHT